MGRTEKARGPRSLGVRDWPFGSRGRRLFLEAVLIDEQPDRGWRKVDLERAAEVERGGVDRLLAGAGALGLVRWDGSRWHADDPLPQVAEPLAHLVRLSRELPGHSIAVLPTRAYRGRTDPTT